MSFQKFEESLFLETPGIRPLPKVVSIVRILNNVYVAVELKNIEGSW